MTDPTSSAPRKRLLSGSQIAFLVVAGLAIAFGLANFTYVRVNWLFGVWRAPLVIALGIAFLLGAGFGGLMAYRAGMRRAER